MELMSKSKKQPDAKPESKPPVLYLRLTNEHEAALQEFISRQRVKPERTQVGMAALEELLAKEGLWPPKAK